MQHMIETVPQVPCFAVVRVTLAAFRLHFTVSSN